MMTKMECSLNDGKKEKRLFKDDKMKCLSENDKKEKHSPKHDRNKTSSLRSYNCNFILHAHKDNNYKCYIIEGRMPIKVVITSEGIFGYYRKSYLEHLRNFATNL